MANEVCVGMAEAAKRLHIGVNRYVIAVAEIERLASTGVSLVGQPGRPRKVA